MKENETGTITDVAAMSNAEVICFVDNVNLLLVLIEAGDFKELLNISLQGWFSFHRLLRVLDFGLNAELTECEWFDLMLIIV